MLRNASKLQIIINELIREIDLPIILLGGEEDLISSQLISEQFSNVKSFL